MSIYGVFNITRRGVYFTSLAFVTLVTLWIFSSRYLETDRLNPMTVSPYPSFGERPASGQASSQLADLALEKALKDAAPIFGSCSPKDFKLKTSRSTWMSKHTDDTPLVHMNIPGTHDSSTWNYSASTQKALNHVTDLAGLPTSSFPADFWRCQRRSLIDMLNAGVRAFDLRFAFDVTNTTLVFWHGPGLQSQTATVEDVLFGFYTWLENHPTETVFLSFQREHPFDSPAQQLLLYEALTSSAAQRYISPSRGTLGTLGNARGKISLLRRFDLDLLPSNYEESLPGLHFSPSEWTVNGDNIQLTYNETTGATAFIEDYYAPDTEDDSGVEINIASKFNTTVAALERAASREKADSLFWSFASSTNIGQSDPKTPSMQALGNGTFTPNGGVNDQLLRWLREGGKGHRYGLVMFDFFDQPGNLIDAFLDVQAPELARAIERPHRL
ncbi:PLC-like phosphodiesterase [Polychaeton citri CBS 116435]|uniref:PLC-like phosphodiesterase n=1 Tax=Polychaeton citri CBS 116435 TaxID=1314669 RepID=A0A9P4Q4Z4_9PEZI|nr:PLC-like phosphodiesterase [Polychaeton citri CBS 116435]